MPRIKWVVAESGNVSDSVDHMKERSPRQRIGLLHYTMPPTIGGVERVLAAHARLFRADGHEVILLSAENVPGFADAGDQGEKTENRQRMREFIVGQRLDVLFVHNVFTMPFCRVATDVCGELAASDLSVVSWVHDLAAANRYYSIGPDDILRQHPPGARVVAISEARATSYRAVTGHGDVTVVPNGIDALDELAGGLCDSRPELRGTLRGAFPVLLHPTRILRRKNIGLGLRVVADLKRRGLQPRLLITGARESFTGDQAAHRQELDALATALGVSGEVLFLGDTAPVTDAELAALYAVADGLFFPSEEEGFGLPVLEAAVRGLPVFTSDTQPLAELAGRNGLLFPLTRDPVLVAEEMVEFLGRHPAAQVRRAARNDFDWTAIYQRHICPLLPRINP